MKIKRFMPILAIIASCLGLMTAAVTFSDVEGHWAYEQIMEYAEKGIVNGDTEGTFRPDDAVTREEFCKIMLNSFDYAGQYDGEQSFSDVSTDRWSYDFVELSKEYLPGYADGNVFKPEEAARREDVTAAIVKLMGYPVYAGADLSASFTDADAIEENLLPYVNIAVNKGLIKNYPNGSFMPDGGITRAEAVTLVARAVKAYDEKNISWNDALAIIDSVGVEKDSDSTVVMTVNDYPVSLSEYRYYYMTYKKTFDTYFGTDWINDESYHDMFLAYFDESVCMTGVVHSEAEAQGVKVSQRSIRENIFDVYYSYVDIYGENFDETLYTELSATPYFVLLNQMTYAYYESLYETLYGSESAKFDELAATIRENYVRVKHVLIQHEGDELSKKRAHQDAFSVYDMAYYGHDFDELVETYGEDPGMEYNPNGYVFTYGDMVEPFEKAAFALEENAISMIVETDYGFHIIKRLPLDDEIILNSAAYATAANASFSEFIIERITDSQVAKSENFDRFTSEIVMEAFAEVPAVDAEEVVDEENVQENN